LTPAKAPASAASIPSAKRWAALRLRTSLTPGANCATGAKTSRNLRATFSRETIGYEDLDQYGAWRQVPPYGWVWGAGGDDGGMGALPARPLGVGRSVGWTWMDDAPWGFAPFHYGRLGVRGLRLGMGAGAMAVRPVYSPALVAFVGVGGVGMAAWFPLGPAKSTGRAPDARYVNQGVVGAVDSGSPRCFRGRAAGGAGHGDCAAARNHAGPGGRRTAPMAPVRESVLTRPVGAAAVRTPPARVADRAVLPRPLRLLAGV